MNSNLARVLWLAAERDGDRPAIVERERTVDYAGLRQRAAAIAAALRAAGVAPDDRVGILLERGPDAAAACFGVLAAGAIAVPVNEALRRRQIEYILQHSGARYLVAASELFVFTPGRLTSDLQVLNVGGIAAPGKTGREPAARTGGDVALIVYTSGSTGLPKGVMLTHANLWAGMEAVVGYLGLTREDRIASLLPFSFVYGLSQLLCAAGTGAALVVERSPLPEEIVATLRSQQVSVLAAVPPLWLRLLRVASFRDAPLAALRRMTNAGGHLPREAVRALRRAQPRAQLYLMYGLTEALRSTYLPPDEVDRRPDSIGRAIPGAQISVVREDGTPAAAGEIGELVHRGPTVALGYWNDPELTAQVFRCDPLGPPGTPDSERVVFSGDLVRRDAAGFFYFVSRKDRILKTLGYRVGPDEIASVLYASGEVVEAVVAGEADEECGERIVAYVVLSEGGSLARLKVYCGRELPRYMQPARIDVRDRLPKLPSGKHDLAAVRAGDS